MKRVGEIMKMAGLERSLGLVDRTHWKTAELGAANAPWET